MPICVYDKAVIFDCDGILVDTELLKFQAWQQALGENDLDFSLDNYKDLIGYSSEHIVHKLKELKNLKESNEVLIRKQNEIYKILHHQNVFPVKETINCVKDLAAKRQMYGIKLGVASSASKLEIIHNLKTIGLFEAFDKVISGKDDLQDIKDSKGTNKPAPYIYQRIAEWLEIPPTKCLVLEDTKVGIEAAIGAKMIAIAIPNLYTKHQDFSKATKIISSQSLSADYLMRILNNSV